MRALRVTIEDTGTGRSEEHVFARSPIRIGRTRLNDLTLDSAYVSHYHSIISFDDDAIEYFDLGSTNGTFQKGATLKPFVPVAIDEGAPLGIGPLRLMLVHCDAQVADRRGIVGGDTDVNRAKGTEVNPGAVQELRQAQTTVDALRPAYQAYRAAWQKLHDDLRATLTQIIPPVRAMVIPYVPEAFPKLAHEPEFRSLMAALGASNSRAVGEPALDTALLLGLSKDVAGADHDGKRLLQQVAGVLAAFASCFVELRRGLDQFGSELAVRAFSRQTGLHAAQTGQEVLNHLLSNDDDKNRTDELTSAFADIMIHQVALLTGVTEGVRTLLEHVAPTTVATDLASNPERVAGIAIRKGIWPFSVTALWRRFRRLHANLVEEDRGVSQVLFGREFARSYDAAKMRHQSNAGDERPSPSRRPPPPTTPRPKSRG